MKKMDGLLQRLEFACGTLSCPFHSQRMMKEHYLMMMPPRDEHPRTYIGIDNGVSGSIGFVYNTGVAGGLFPTPIFSQLSFQKSVKRHISRIDVPKLHKILGSIAMNPDPKVFLERPYINPKGLVATMSAVRALEATLIVIEGLNLPYEYIDSRRWQKQMLPSDIKTSIELKKASRDVGKRLWPTFFGLTTDYDALLIAEWARREKL